MRSLNFLALLFLFALGAALETKQFYLGGALDFLRSYGRAFHLFKRFFGKEDGSLSPNGGFDDLYNVRGNYYASKSTAPLNSFSANTSFNVPIADPKYVELNNLFRFGSDPLDRFMEIFFHKDPWVDVDSTVNFVGSYDQLKNRAVFCRFSFPFEAITQLQFASIVRCPIPVEGRQNLSEEIDHVVLDLYETVAGQNITLLSEIRVFRENPLDRRAFNVSLFTMISNFEDPVLLEWMTYHIMLGVEHFYIFDNSKHDVDLKAVSIRPYLDANLITLIHFPFCPVLGQGGGIHPVTKLNYEHWNRFAL